MAPITETEFRQLSESVESLRCDVKSLAVEQRTTNERLIEVTTVVRQGNTAARAADGYRRERDAEIERRTRDLEQWRADVSARLPVRFITEGELRELEEKLENATYRVAEMEKTCTSIEMRLSRWYGMALGVIAVAQVIVVPGITLAMKALFGVELP